PSSCFPGYEVRSAESMRREDCGRRMRLATPPSLVGSSSPGYGQAPRPAVTMKPETLAGITTDLSDFTSAYGEDAAVREALLQVAWSRLTLTVDMIPEELRAGDVLQLGAEPYLLTLCLRRVCTGRLTLVNYFGVDELRGRQVLVNRRTGERLELEYDHFNVE